MAIPAPYIPQIQTPAVQPFGAADVVNMLQAQEQLTGLKERNRLQAMLVQDYLADRNVNRLAAQEGLNQPPPEPPKPPAGIAATPQPATPNPLLAEQPQIPLQAAVNTPEQVHSYFTSDRDNPNTPDPAEDQDGPYAVRIPGRATRSWLMEKARAGEILPEAAMRYDQATQELVQKQTQLYEQQGQKYAQMVQPEVEAAIEAGDMKALRAIAVRTKKELKSNPLAQMKADHMIAAIDKGTVFGPGKTATTYDTITQENVRQYTDMLKPFLGDRVPVPGEVYKIKSKNGQILDVEQNTAASKEPASTEANYRQGLEEQIRKAHPEWSVQRVRFEAAKQVREENEKAKTDRVKVTLDLKGEQKAKEKAADRRDAEKTGFSSWSKDDKEWWFENTKNTHEYPNFGWGKAAAHNRAQYSLEYAQYLKGKGITGQQARATAEEFKSNVKSFTKQSFNRDMMKSFIKNIDAQIDRWSEITKDVARYDSRLLNVPLRVLRKKIVGTPYENEMELYITEISSEAARLASGNAQSIAQMTDANIKHWQDIHDENLSINDMRKLLKETKNAGAIRLKSVEDVQKETRGKMKGTGGKGPLDKATAMRFLQQAGGDKDKARELARTAGYEL